MREEKREKGKVNRTGKWWLVVHVFNLLSSRHNSQRVTEEDVGRRQHEEGLDRYFLSYSSFTSISLIQLKKDMSEKWEVKKEWKERSYFLQPPAKNNRILFPGV